jgi:DNA-binding CsgD family transcriptional regulator
MRDELPPAASEMTGRQIEVMRLLCNGFTSAEIADELSLSKRTVEFHKAQLFNKLGVRNENELIRIALYLGLIKQNELDFYGRTFCFEAGNRQQRKENKEEGGKLC